MPDLIELFIRRWKFITGFTLCATLVAILITIAVPKEYLSTATALPVNSVTADRARIFNSNIQALYSDFGTPDELDRMEGTAKLDTLFIAAAKENNLAEHYGIPNSGEADYKAALKLQKHTEISRSGYGELQIKVWDEDRNLSAKLANDLLSGLEKLHQHLQNQNASTVLQKVKEAYASACRNYSTLTDSLATRPGNKELLTGMQASLLSRIEQYQKMIDEYQIYLNTDPQVLLTVEPARPSLWPDKPKGWAIALFTLFGALLFSYLLAMYQEKRKSLP